MKRRAFLGATLLALAGAAGAKTLGSKASRSAGTDPFTNITAPGGSASFIANWGTQAGADGYLVYISTSSQTVADPAVYAYRYKATGQATANLTISGIAGGTYYWRVAAYVGSVVMDLGHQVQVTAA